MSFYTNLSNHLEGKIPKSKLTSLPRSYNILGKILILKLKPSLYTHRKKIGKTILEILPSLRTVALQKTISGKTRKPKIMIIAGEKVTKTIQKEHGCSFFMDIKDIMWSKGNKAEKIRMKKLVKPRETVVDMFAGIGYFTIIIAKYCKPKKIYAIDINPKASDYMERNILLNKLKNIEILKGNCKDFAEILKNSADRIIMGHFEAEKFLPSALKIAKKGASIHLHKLLPEKDTKNKEIILENIIHNISEYKKQKYHKIHSSQKLINKNKIKILKIQKVKSYAPGILHVVVDIRVL